MHQVEPSVYLIGRSSINLEECREWLESLGLDGFPIQQDGCTAGEKLVQLAGKRCYLSFKVGTNPNISRIREDMGEFIDNILSVGHGSVLRHATCTFAIEGVSRVCTAELNRHSVGMAVSEGSLRFIRFEDMGYWVPDSIRERYGDSEDVVIKKERSREIFHRAFTVSEQAYRNLQMIWEDELSPVSPFKHKKAITSMMRRVVPMGVATGGVWSGNIQALRHIFTMRCAPEAEEEILLVASLMLEKLIEEEPLFFRDFHKDADGYWRPKYKKV